MVNSKGLLKSISPCQCLPKTEGTSLAISGIQFACPAGKLAFVSAKVVCLEFLKRKRVICVFCYFCFVDDVFFF